MIRCCCRKRYSRRAAVAFVAESLPQCLEQVAPLPYEDSRIIEMGLGAETRAPVVFRGYTDTQWLRRHRRNVA